MTTLNTIEEKRRLHYYDLCINNKDWTHGVLKEVLDIIDQEYAAGRVRDMLEVGCGVGDMVPQLPGGLKYTGLDPTVYSIEQSKKTYPQHTFVVGSGEHLPFPNASFDMVYSFQTLQMVKDPRQTLSEIARVIRPGGYALLISPNLECPWSFSRSVQHYSAWQTILLTLGRCRDLILRFFGHAAFRVIPKTYAEATGHYDGKDHDLKYIVSTWEVLHYLEEKGLTDIGSKKSQRRWMRLFGPLRYYGGGMYLLMCKNR